MSSLLNDVRYGARVLRKRPGFTLVAVLTLALGIGANTAIFSVVDAVLLKPLPYADPSRLVAVWETAPDEGAGRSRWRVAPGTFLDWRRESQVFERLAAFGHATANLTENGEPEQLDGVRASADYFAALGVRPLLGRAFLPEEHEPGRGQVVILGHELWQRRFGASQDITGQAVVLGGAAYTVVGVMPPAIYPSSPTAGAKYSFTPARQQYWVPMSFNAEWAANRRSHVLGVIGRLKAGVTLERAQAEMDAVARRLSEEHEASRGEGVQLRPLMDEVAGSVRPALLALLGAVGLVLLAACANVVNLLLAQCSARRKEIAVRAALGASRAQLVRQFFAEGLLLSLAGGAAGVWLAVFGADALLKIIPQAIPRLEQVGLDWRVLGFTSLLALLTSVAFGLAPAWQHSRPGLQEALKSGGRTAGPGAGGQRLRRLLVVAQLTLAVMLVVGAGLLIKSFWRLRQVAPGFDPQRLLVLDLTLPAAKYGRWQQVTAFHAQLLERLHALPGVRSAAVTYDHPLESNWIDAFRIEGRPDPGPGQRPSANLHPVSWEYFHTAGVELRRGRPFTSHDDPAHPGAVIVNEAFARRYFPDADPLGQRLRIATPAGLWNDEMPSVFEIVGVARDVKSAGLHAAAEPAYYVPSRQMPLPDMKVLVRTDGDPAEMAAAVREAVWAIDAKQPVAHADTMERIVSENIAQPRFNTLLMGLFGAVALLLAAVGVYGVMSYAVAQRTHELGVRVALGAQGRDILRLVVGQGARLGLAGVAAGLAGSLALTRLLAGLLYGVSATDPIVFIAVSLLLFAVALAACYVPARRATKVDPLEALRYE